MTKEIIYQSTRIDFGSKETPKASNKFFDMEKCLQGWIDTGNISLREYVNHKEGKQNIVLKFTTSMTSSEKLRITSLIDSGLLWDVKVIDQDTSRIEVGLEVDYKKTSAIVQEQEYIITETGAPPSTKNAFKDAVNKLYNHYSQKQQVTP